MNTADIRLVSWDVDGTLFSYFRLAMEFLRSDRCTLGQFAKVCRFHRLVESQRRAPDSAVVLAELEPMREVQARESEVLEKLLRRIDPRPRAVALLQRFAATGIPQVAFSDFESGYKLKALGLSHYLQRTYSAYQLGYWKPSPIPLARIQRDFGIRPDQHLHIGDRRDADGEACRRNGCHFQEIRGETGHSPFS